MKQQQTERQLWAFFSDLPDPRVSGRTARDLFDIVTLALCAVMAGAKGWGAGAGFGEGASRIYVKAQGQI